MLIIFYKPLPVRNQTPDCLDVSEEMAGNNSDNGIGRNGDKHSEDSRCIAGYEQDNENLERTGVDACLLSTSDVVDD